MRDEAGGLDIPREPVDIGFSTSHATHRLVERMDGLELVPGTRGPLYFGIFFLLLAPVAWYLTRDLDIPSGLKVGAWLFPIFAGTGPLIMFFVMRLIGARVVFDTMREEVRTSGIRLGRRTIPMKSLRAVQTCYAGRTHGDGSWEKYELNLVFDDDGAGGAGGPERLCVVCHSGRSVIERQARDIADKLRIDLIDCIEENRAAGSE